MKYDSNLLVFKKKIENFICEHCGVKVTGEGYTNHCPQCLYSKHVDINPGDRANICGGLMKPIGVITRGSEIVSIIHRCEVCGFKKRNKREQNDNFEILLSLIQKPVIC